MCRSNHSLQGISKKKMETRQLIFGESISGKKVISDVNDVYNMFSEMLENGMKCSDNFENIDKYL